MITGQKHVQHTARRGRQHKHRQDSINRVRVVWFDFLPACLCVFMCVLVFFTLWEDKICSTSQSVDFISFLPMSRIRNKGWDTRLWVHVFAHIYVSVDKHVFSGSTGAGRAGTNDISNHGDRHQQGATACPTHSAAHFTVTRQATPR